MRVVHVADVHLDAPFAWAGPAAGAARRQAIRDALRAAVELARQQAADALCVAGDLFEHERVSEDTARFLADLFASLGPARVLLAPGNHDWYGPASIYHRTAWPANVTVFTSDRLTPIELEPGLTVWGGAHLGPASARNFLDGFVVDRGGVNLALFHGSEQAALPAQEQGKRPYAPFTARQVADSGLDHALVGHLHTPIDAARHTYPGNPEPLAFGETGERAAVCVDVAADGTVVRTRHVVARTAVHDLDLDVTGLAHSDDLRAAVLDLLRDRRGIVRLTLCGDLDPVIDLNPDTWRSAVGWLDGLIVRTTGLHEAFDLPALQREGTVRGEFVRDLLAAGLDPDRTQRILVTGLRALAGRSDLEVR